MIGIEAAAAMGALAGDPEKELMVISEATEEQVTAVREFLEKDAIQVEMEKTDIKLYVRVEVFAGGESASVEIKHTPVSYTHLLRGCYASGRR